MASELSRYATANARVRALLSRMLGRSGLETLYGYPSGGAVLDALARSPYATPGGGSLGESSLATRVAAVGRSVLEVLAEPERSFLRLYLLHHEVENLKLVIRAVHLHLDWEDFAPHIAPLAGIATVDVRALAAAHDLRELAALLRNSAYGAPLRAALHRIDEAGPFALEIAVDLDYYERLWAAAGGLRRSDAARARGLLGILFDLLNISWIARYRDALGLAPEEILNYTLRQGRWISTDDRRNLAENPDTSWATALGHTPYGPLFAAAEDRGFDVSMANLWRFLAVEVQRVLSSYPFHIGVPLGFLLAQEIEVRDLQVLLAAKSLGLPPSEILDRIATVRH